MAGPLISVVIPCYNAARWLPETLDSVLRQSHADLEVIAVDDGSTDLSWDILQRSTDPRLHALRQANAGAAAARNHALRQVRGAFVQFLDADDVLDRDKLRAQVGESMRRGAGWVIASRWGRFRDDVSATRWEPPWNPAAQRGIDWLVNAWTAGDMMPPHGWLVPRAIVDAVGPWDPAAGINDDGEYFMRVLLAAEGVAQAPEARVHYRSGNPSYSQRSDPWAWESVLNSYESCARHLLAAEDSARVRLAIANRLSAYRYAAYPRFPRLVARAGEIARSLGLPPKTPQGGGRASRMAGRLIGWKLTRRLGTLVHG